MGTLIDHLATDRLRGGRLLIAYAVGLILGITIALIALLAAGTTP
jgi:hypothetical protein